jgi:hypothetical protein
MNLLRCFFPGRAPLGYAFLSILLASRLAAQAQAPAVLWSTNLNARVFAVDDQTNVYANVGGTVITINSAGVPVQTNAMCPNATTVQRDAGGDFYFAGQAPGGVFNGSWTDYPTNSCFLARFTSAGTLVWSNRFGPTSLRSLNLHDLQFDTAGDIYVAYRWNISTTDHSSDITKLNAATGSRAWTAAMPKNGNGATQARIRLGPLFGTNGFGITFVDTTAPIATVAVMSRFNSTGVPTALTNWSQSSLVPSLFENPVANSSGDWYLIESSSLTKRSASGALLWSRPVPSSVVWVLGQDPWDGVYTGNAPDFLQRYDVDGNVVWSLSLPGETAAAMVTGTNGNRFVSTASGTVIRLGAETLAMPAVNTPPLGQTVFSGSNAVLSVSASGSTPLRYYWLFGGVPQGGQTNATLNFSPALPANSGTYAVIVSNFLGSVTSAPALLRVKSVAVFSGNQILTNGTYVFSNPPTLNIRSTYPAGSSFYTLDGSAPSFTSTFYSGPFVLAQSATIRAIGYSSDFTQSEEADTVNAIVPPTYTVTVTPSGGGSVTLSPPGGVYVEHSVVTATAVPSPGWSFLFWEGDASGSDRSVPIPMETNRTIRALFGTSLSTTVSGNGQVVLDPGSGFYAHGTVVRLTGVPQPGNFFGFWGNAATGNTNPLYFTVSAPTQTVSSVFGAVPGGQAALTVRISGRGTVDVNPRANVYTLNQPVTLTATPDAGQSFVNWSGDASGTQNPLPVTMDQNKVITANFSGAIVPSTSWLEAGGMAVNGFQLTVTGQTHTAFQILGSSNLTSWQHVGVVSNEAGQAPFLDATATNAPWRFYRALSWP